jgi:NAD+ synthase
MTGTSLHRPPTRADFLPPLDAAQEAERLASYLRRDILHTLRRRGGVVGCSGGVDSSVVLALAVRALGTDRVLALLMPERESSPESLELALGWARALGVEAVIEDITPALEGAGCYRRRDEAVRRLFPEYGPGWKCRIGIPGSLLDRETLNVFSLTVVSPEGKELQQRIVSTDYFQIVAASGFKQRTRMAMLYYHAELHNYAVIGTPNRNEHDLGFFVKYGDGGTDLSPIQHLHKTQVYELAAYLGVPEEIRSRPPTSDTYSAGGTQEEFFFRVPFEILDPIWMGWERGVPAEEIGKAIGITPEQSQRIIDDLIRKQRTTQYLRQPTIVYPAPSTGSGPEPLPPAGESSQGGSASRE